MQFIYERVTIQDQYYYLFYPYKNYYLFLHSLRFVVTVIQPINEPTSLQISLCDKNKLFQSENIINYGGK